MLNKRHVGGHQAEFNYFLKLWMCEAKCLHLHYDAFTLVQPHYYRVRQVEPCHQLG